MNLNFKDIVKKARKNSGLSQDEFCKELGKAQGTVSKYETGLHIPPGKVIIRCIRFIQENEAKEVNIDEDLLDLMKKLDKFSGEGMAQKRAALHSVIDALLL